MYETNRSEVKYSSLRIIINEIFKIEHFDNVKLAKYMRCLLQITISDSNLAASLIEDICGMIKQSAEVSTLTYKNHSD